MYILYFNKKLLLKTFNTFLTTIASNLTNK